MIKNFLIKKEFFVQSSSDNIKDHYEILEVQYEIILDYRTRGLRDGLQE